MFLAFKYKTAEHLQMVVYIYANELFVLTGGRDREHDCMVTDSLHKEEQWPGLHMVSAFQRSSSGVAN